eukprot:Seg2612.3 transcript_id=Seg2612.3/GoldUCD/mRNA.D3Y31 product="NSFL1 cofactor p47" protein_id=Seg2612.3/GoldUCD/D3Y31
MADRQQLLQEFMSVTGANAERSQFYLEAAGWELHVALSSFYDEGGQDDGGDSLVQTTAAPATSRRPAQSSGDKSAPSGRFGTVSSFKKDGEESSEDSDDEGQAFYAGGSESSGQQIIGPPKKKVNPDKITQRIFDAAKRQGAEPEDEVERPGPRQRQAFVGAGYRLGSEPSTSEQVTASMQPPADQSNEPVNVRLKFWSNGFSLDDGLLRSFDDPNNRAFLNSIEKGEIPGELVQAARGSEVHVSIEDNRQQEYVKPKLKLAAFSGHGRMLGSPTPEIAANPPPAASSSAPPPSYEVHVDEAQPITTLQIRLADGTRLVSKFNHTHTVADIRNMVRRARPGTGDNFILMTTFPNKELTDDTKTIADSSLLNAVIVQRKR